MFSKTLTVRPRPGFTLARPAPRLVVARSGQPNVEKAIADAEEACKDDANAKECANAWDDVEELSAAVAHKKDSQPAYEDPLEKYCESVPDADECRVYED